MSSDVEKLFIVQSKGISQKILALDLSPLDENDEFKALKITDYTCRKLVDKQAEITSFSLCKSQAVPNDIFCLVFDYTRLIVYNFMDKEIVYKFKFGKASKVYIL